MHIKVLSTNTVGSTFHPNRYSSWNQMKSSSLILSGNEIISWEIIRPQLCAFHTISPLCPSLQGTGSWTVSHRWGTPSLSWWPSSAAGWTPLWHWWCRWAFGTGIGEAKHSLANNGSPALYYKEFNCISNVTSVVIPVNKDYESMKSNGNPKIKVGFEVQTQDIKRIILDSEYSKSIKHNIIKL